MTQPIEPVSKFTDCIGQTIDAPVNVPTVRDAGIPAAWAILGIVIALAIFEVWALSTHHNTISHLMQRLARGHSWFRWLALAGLGLLGWHLFWGFP